MAFLALVIWLVLAGMAAVIAPLRVPWGIALLGALLAAGIVAPRHQMLPEFRGVDVASDDGRVAARVTGPRPVEQSGA